MAVFFEGRQTQNSEDNIELGDGGGGTWPLWCGTSWDGCFFLKNPVESKYYVLLQGKARNRQLSWLVTVLTGGFMGDVSDATDRCSLRGLTLGFLVDQVCQ